MITQEDSDHSLSLGKFWPGCPEVSEHSRLDAFTSALPHTHLSENCECDLVWKRSLCTFSLRSQDEIILDHLPGPYVKWQVSL